MDFAKAHSIVTSAAGQTEKNSVRAYVFRFAPELGHCSTQSACLKRARKRHRVPFPKNGQKRTLDKPRDRLAIARLLDPGSSTHSDFGPDPPDFRFFLSGEHGI